MALRIYLHGCELAYDETLLPSIAVLESPHGSLEIKDPQDLRSVAEAAAFMQRGAGYIKLRAGKALIMRFGQHPDAIMKAD